MNNPTPSLFGINRSNRNFTDPYYWGKNQFNSSFPVALACYMRSKNEPLIYICHGTSGQSVLKTLDAAELFGTSENQKISFFLLKRVLMHSVTLYTMNYPLLIWSLESTTPSSNLGQLKSN
jgi:hypothetical protein